MKSIPCFFTLGAVFFLASNGCSLGATERGAPPGPQQSGSLSGHFRTVNLLNAEHADVVDFWQDDDWHAASWRLESAFDEGRAVMIVELDGATIHEPASFTVGLTGGVLVTVRLCMFGIRDEYDVAASSGSVEVMDDDQGLSVAVTADAEDGMTTAVGILRTARLWDGEVQLDAEH